MIRCRVQRQAVALFTESTEPGSPGIYEEATLLVKDHLAVEGNTIEALSRDGVPVEWTIIEVLGE